MIDNLINQTTNFCQKILNTQGYKEFSKTNFIYHIVTGIEDIGDRYRSLYEDYCVKNIKKINSGTINLLKKLDSMLNEFFLAFRKFNTENLTNIGYKYHEILFDLEKEYGRVNQKEIFIISYIADINNRIYDLLEPLMALYSGKLSL